MVIGGSYGRGSTSSSDATIVIHQFSQSIRKVSSDSDPFNPCPCFLEAGRDQSSGSPHKIPYLNGSLT